MVVAITGGTGFIGRHVVNTFIERGVPVRLLTRRPEMLRRWWPKGDVEAWAGDMTEPETLRGFADSAQVIYHLAGEIHNVNSFNSVNVDGTRALLKTCCGKNIARFVYLSSVGVMGASGAGSVNESAPCNPKNEYERSKFAGEQIVLSAFTKYRIPVTVLRPTIVFGEGQNRDSLAQWLSAIQKGFFRFIGTGDAVANYVYVADVVEACLLAARCDKAMGQIYIVEDSCSLYDFVGAAAEFLDVRMPSTLPTWIAYLLAAGLELAGKVTRGPVPLTRSRIKALTSCVVYSGDKLRRTLGFRPHVGWREGLRRTIEWYMRNGLLSSAESS